MLTKDYRHGIQQNPGDHTFYLIDPTLKLLSFNYDAQHWPNKHRKLQKPATHSQNKASVNHLLNHLPYDRRSKQSSDETYMRRPYQIRHRDGYETLYWNVDKGALKALQQSLEEGNPAAWNRYKQAFEKKHPPRKDGSRQQINLEGIDLHVLVDKPETERNYFYTGSGNAENPNTQTKIFRDDFGADLPANCRNSRTVNLNAWDFENVNLRGANLSGTQLKGANFAVATLKGTYFVEADLGCLVLNGRTILEGADFTGANLVEARLHGTNLQGAKFAGANLTSADMIGDNLQLADLSGAVLQDAFLNDSDLSAADLRNVRWSGAKFWGEGAKVAGALGVHPGAERIEGIDGVSLKIEMGNSHRLIDVSTMVGNVERIAEKMGRPQLPPGDPSKPVALDTPDTRTKGKEEGKHKPVPR